MHDLFLVEAPRALVVFTAIVALVPVAFAALALLYAFAVARPLAGRKTPVYVDGNVHGDLDDLRALHGRVASALDCTHLMACVTALTLGTALAVSLAPSMGTYLLLAFVLVVAMVPVAAVNAGATVLGLVFALDIDWRAKERP